MLQKCFILLALRLSTAYENIALLKPAWQAHPYHTVLGVAGDAVDGRKTNLSYWGGQCTSSDGGQLTATWWVNLSSVFSVHHLMIFYRTENRDSEYRQYFAPRFLGFYVYVSNTTNRQHGHLCFHETNYTPSTIPAVINIACPVHGQYVIYYNKRFSGNTNPAGYSAHAFNDLCEVEVYGCPVPGYFGPDCSFPCRDTNCRYCHIETGSCQGCKPGYKGHQCKLPCSSQYYGELCMETCGNCSDGMTCDNIYGTCTNGCDIGVFGDKCKTPCPVGWHGKNCSLTCTNCDTCDRFTGQCTSPCYEGWTGADCNDECDGRKYGRGCKLNCGVCLDYTQCHHVNGSCLQGCDAGFEGNLCNDECSPGTFGENCTQNCSNNCEGDPKLCNATTGECMDGCHPGYDGLQCDRECYAQKYGENCKQTCGKCRDSERCHHVNGTCLNGCDKGFGGISCIKEYQPQYYGYNCADNCSTSCINQTCDSINGVCYETYTVQEQKVKSEDNNLAPIIGGVVGVLLACLLVVVIVLVLRRNKKKLDEGKKFHPSESTNCTKDAVLKVNDDGKVNNVYQELTELSQPSIYDSLH